jgi:hypothetical protein
MNRQRVAWDIDGTLYFNFLELDFFGYVNRWGGRDKILPYNVTNPMVCPRDVQHVLTFRPSWWREQTEKELLDHGFHPMQVLMNTGGTDMHPWQSVLFKAQVLNKRKFDIYVDNDDILRRNLQPLTRTHCMSVEEFYMGTGDNIRLVV